MSYIMHVCYLFFSFYLENLYIILKEMFLLSYMRDGPHTWSTAHMRDEPQDGTHVGLPPHMRGGSIGPLSHERWSPSHTRDKSHTWSPAYMRDEPQDRPRVGLPAHVRGRSIALVLMNSHLSFPILPIHS